MKYKSVVDISAIIWNPEDYDNNTSEYFKLKVSIINLLESLNREKPYIVVRHELLSELINGFPYNKMPNSFHAFGNVVFDFLANLPQVNRVVFFGVNLDIVSYPNIVKQYYNVNTQLEANYLISYLHAERVISNTYFTFQYLHGLEEKLVTSSYANHEELLKTETIFADDAAGLENFFKKYRKKFEHNPKHTLGHMHGDEAAPLSCFKENNPATAQKYLEHGVLDGKRYYYYDLENDVYVVFMPTKDNVYHGYDEADRNKVPATIRRIFHK